MIKERIKNVMENFKKYDEKTLLTYQNAIFFVVIGDIIGIYHFLQLKVLGIAILMVSMVSLAAILWLLRELPEEKRIRRRKPKKMEQVEEKKEKSEDQEEETKEKEEPEEETMNLDLDMGLPSSEDYNKRMKKAFGSI